MGAEPCEYREPVALPTGLPEAVVPPYVEALLCPDGPQLPPPQFLQPTTADISMAPCSHQKRLDFLIFDILSV